MKTEIGVATKNRFSAAEREQLTASFQAGFKRLSQSIPAGHSEHVGANNHFDEDFNLRLKGGEHLKKLSI